MNLRAFTRSGIHNEAPSDTSGTARHIAKAVTACGDSRVEATAVVADPAMQFAIFFSEFDFSFRSLGVPGNVVQAFFKD